MFKKSISFWGVLPFIDRFTLTYTLFPKTKRLCDVANICCIHDKFFADTLTKGLKIKDDNYIFLPKVKFEIGEVDKENPRVEIVLEEID